ncbi:hypothetical protein [Lactiplantibacillus modestisalitolerans]|uniref:Uncharacterized protein n=1 Tax=Lactiplantibacillus modestisalitolerans TaxID=1457219 RepID=A0ABV5WT21_9LACO|nr:hypothetical protein [Lactiplantibacillus modestisalitolerans]
MEPAAFSVSYQRGCKPFLKKYARQQGLIKQKVAAALQREVATGMPKVKVATPVKLAGLTCYEFRLNLGALGSARLAFTVQRQHANVYLITTKIQKATFSHELAQVVGR